MLLFLRKISNLREKYSPPLYYLIVSPVTSHGWTTVFKKSCSFANELPLEAIKHTVAYHEKSPKKILCLFVSRQ